MKIKISQKGLVQIPLLILIIVGLFFIAQPTQAGFFDWFTNIKSFFSQNKIEESLPASVSEPMESVSSFQEEPQKNSEEIQSEIQECPSCECSQCPICSKPQVCEPIIKEVPVEKIVYTDKIIYKTDPWNNQLLAECRAQAVENFELYYVREKDITACQATSTTLSTAYRELIDEFEDTLDLLFELNKDYLFQPTLTAKLVELNDFASTSNAIWKRWK